MIEDAGFVGDEAESRVGVVGERDVGNEAG